jgi:uncharacterized protein (DUF1499 family)
MVYRVTGILVLCIFVSGCSGDPSRPLGASGGRLHPCPGKPNCVSTQDPDAKRVMAPLSFMGTKQETRDRILDIVQGMKRSEIVEASDKYIHACFRSRVFGFVDDVEFLLDEDARLVHFRSASRVGTYDFGVNRRRMQEISERYKGAE